MRGWRAIERVDNVVDFIVARVFEYERLGLFLAKAIDSLSAFIYAFYVIWCVCVCVCLSVPRENYSICIVMIGSRCIHPENAVVIFTHTGKINLTGLILKILKIPTERV